MIEATCAACGTVARIAESDVPVGAKFVTCASCKARVPLPATATPAKGVPVKSVSIPTVPKVPPPIPSPKKDIELADLPAPKRNNPLAGTEPSKPAPPRSPLAGADLPTPKAAKPPASPPGALDLDDLMPAPGVKSDAGLADLPAPKAKSSALGDLPAGKGKQSSALADLPAPKGKTSALADLPAPKGKTSALADLPAPKKPAAAFDDELDLPAPKPGANNDLPAPKGFFDDLPQPAKGGGKGPAVGAAPTVDLPAPKGFFDDLPQPAKGGGKGAQTTDVAPKGFFDDLPQPAKGGGKGAQTTDVAPKGFFDDLPQPAKGGASKAGLFDDLPQPTKGAPPAPASGGGGLFDDLPQPSNSAELSLDLGGPGNALDLGGGSGGGAGPDLDLGLPLGESGGFQDLDLGEPVKRGPAGPLPEEASSPIKIKTPAKGAAPAKPIPIVVPKDPKQAAADLKLDLADDHPGGAGAPAAAGKGAAAKKVAKGPTPEEAAEIRAAKRRRSRIVLGAVLGVAVIGGGGFFLYKRHLAQKDRAAKIDSGITAARAALKDEKATHWQSAQSAAQSVIEIDPNNVVALGIAAEASFAGALDSGVNGPVRIAKGRELMTTGLGAAKSTVELDRAQALSYVAANQFDKAIPRLQGLIAQNPGDGWLQLYMGWAQLGIGDAEAAVKAFDQAVAKTKQTKIPALYGHGRAKLLQADIAAARTDFEAILQVIKADDVRSVCPSVQLAATRPPAEAAQRDSELKAILDRKDVKNADPRCITQIYVNLGEVAATNGRLDIARENFRKAIDSTKNDVDALVGLARVEIRENKLTVAADDVQKAMTANPTAVHAQLANAELQVAQGKLSDAQKTIDTLTARKPPLFKLDQAQLQVVKGKLLVAQGKIEDAINAYADGAKLAGDLDLTPTMAAVSLLTDLAKKDPDPAKQEAYHKRANDLLSAFETRAQDDPQLATQLGVAYLQSGDPAKAETFLRRAVEMKDDDPDAKVSLAMALTAQGKTDEAQAQLTAALKIDPNRPDFLLQQAKTYQAAGNNEEAIKSYDKLLANPDAPLVVRADAGKYYVKLGLITRKDDLVAKGAAQAEPILKADPENAAGLYLKGEGLLLKKQYDDAAPALIKATDIDPDAIYLDALGRASWGRYKTSDDKKFIEAARNAYERATKQDPKLVHAQLGLGWMYIEQGHWNEAIPPLVEANRLDPTFSEIMFQLGRAYYAQRNLGKDRAAAAEQWFSAALFKGTPELPLEDRAEAQFRLGDLYDKNLNNAAKCAAAWEQAQALAGEMIKQGGQGAAPTWDWIENYYYLGDTYEKLNNPVAEKKAFEAYLAHGGKNPTHVKVVNDALATRLQRF